MKSKRRPEHGLAKSNAGRHSVLRFVLLLGIPTIGFNVLFYLWFSHQPFFETYLSLNARASAALLNLMGSDVRANGALLSSVDFSLQIKSGCDAFSSSGERRTMVAWASLTSYFVAVPALASRESMPSRWTPSMPM